MNAVFNTILSRLQQLQGAPVQLRRAKALYGENTSSACCLETSVGKYFLQYATACPPDFFAKEASGLQVLATVHCPQYLVQEWLEPHAQQPLFWKNLAAGLAGLHHHTQAQFGWHQNNYIRRLPPLVQQAYDGG